MKEPGLVLGRLRRKKESGLVYERLRRRKEPGLGKTEKEEGVWSSL
jgi:hypothetical protein